MNTKCTEKYYRAKEKLCWEMGYNHGFQMKEMNKLYQNGEAYQHGYKTGLQDRKAERV